MIPPAWSSWKNPGRLVDSLDPLPACSSACFSSSPGCTHRASQEAASPGSARGRCESQAHWRSLNGHNGWPTSPLGPSPSGWGPGPSCQRSNPRSFPTADTSHSMVTYASGLIDRSHTVLLSSHSLLTISTEDDSLSPFHGRSKCWHVGAGLCLNVSCEDIWNRI